MTFKKYIVLLLGILISLGVSRVLTIDPCLKEVDTIFKNMYTSLPKNGKVVFVNYEIITNARTQNDLYKGETKSTDIKMYTSDQQYRFISEDICIYQDKNSSFTVIPSRKVIYWADASIASNKDDRIKNIQSMQDTLFKSSKKVECTSLKNDPSGATKIVKLIPNKRWTDATQISHVDYYINSDKSQIIKQIIAYNENTKLKSTEYVFKEVNYDYKKININVPVKSLFINASSKLIAPYQGYELIDVRKKKNKL